ncbi:MAG: iron-molybdenum cofactor biosynthesis protein [Candidatus Marinimicrobia bacterium]|nr:iron-molybdenum cofactor biosynthesis protein [Candidatus Neomarinimicrobiota bacterium]
MKIGIASNDQRSIAQHFGRSKGFVIAELVDGSIKSKDYRENVFTNHLQQGTHEHQGGHGHSHEGILTALNDCDVVIARGMGRRIYDDLRGANIESLITEISTVDDALVAYVSGTLVDNPEKGCVH